uniref:Uncharacterized protein n=2 Tax=Physcomitrium patens TaxID=3218 RepID=A0A7I4F351_PHYPA
MVGARVGRSDYPPHL